MADTKVQVTPQSLKDFAKWLDELADALKKLSAETLMTPGVLPGTFPHADWLKKLVETSKQSVQKNLENLRHALREISENLLLIAKEYEKTEDINKMKSKELEQLLKDVAKYLPDATTLYTGNNPYSYGSDSDVPDGEDDDEDDDDEDKPKPK